MTQASSQMRTAVIGIRGIPANYGGFETFAEELAPRLARRGHDVTVYCRAHTTLYTGASYRGVRLVVLPTIATKYLDTPLHTMVSCFHALGQHYDVVLVCNAANALFAGILRLAGVPVVLNVDGIERLRKKWGPVGRGWYWISEYLATRIPSATVADAAVIQDYYRDKWRHDSTMIPYGADTDRTDSQDALIELGLRSREYVLVVTRLEPENNPDKVIRAFADVHTDMPLVIVGDAPYADAYKRLLESLAAKDHRVILAGSIYGKGYRELQSHAYCYVQATEVGGTHPALIEGMGLGGCVVANGTPENAEVLSDCGILFTPGDGDCLGRCLQHLVDNPAEADDMRRRARARIEAEYSWDAVTNKYEELLRAQAVDV